MFVQIKYVNSISSRAINTVITLGSARTFLHVFQYILFMKNHFVKVSIEDNGPWFESETAGGNSSTHNYTARSTR